MSILISVKVLEKLVRLIAIILSANRLLTAYWNERKLVKGNEFQPQVTPPKFKRFSCSPSPVPPSYRGLFQNKINRALLGSIRCLKFDLVLVSVAPI